MGEKLIKNSNAYASFIITTLELHLNGLYILSSYDKKSI